MGKITKCRKCHQEILQKNPTQCPYCRSTEFVTEEESNQIFEEGGLKTGKVTSISFLCPYCGAKQSINSKLKEITCSKCMRMYKVPEKARGLF